MRREGTRCQDQKASRQRDVFSPNMHLPSETSAPGLPWYYKMVYNICARLHIMKACFSFTRAHALMHLAGACTSADL